MNNICGLFGITQRVVCIFFRFMFCILINKNEINNTKKKREPQELCVFLNKPYFKETIEVGA